MRPIETDSLYNDVYVRLCEKIKGDPQLSVLLEGVVFDYEPIDGLVPAGTPIALMHKPKLSVIPVSAQYEGQSSCGGELVLAYNVVLEGFHIRSSLRNKIAWRLLYLFKWLTIPISVDEVERAAICIPGVASWDFDGDKQTMSHTIPISFQFMAL